MLALNRIVTQPRLGVGMICPSVRYFKSKQHVSILTGVPDEYLKRQSSSENNAKDPRAEMFKYVYHDPTLLQKLTILRARFLATGWIYLMAVIVTYVLIKIIQYVHKYLNREKYCV